MAQITCGCGCGCAEVLGEATVADPSMMCAHCCRKKSDKHIMFSGGELGVVGTDMNINLAMFSDRYVKNDDDVAATADISIVGGTATGATIDAGAGPVNKTLVNGTATVAIGVTGAGTVELGLSNLTHPEGNTLEAGPNITLTFNAP